MEKTEFIFPVAWKHFALPALIGSVIGLALIVNALEAETIDPVAPIGTAIELQGTSGARYFAEVDANGIVKRVIVANPSVVNSGIFGDPGRFVETAVDGSGRKNYAGIGDKYDNSIDAFVPSKPYPSWTLDEQTAQWKAPKAHPKDGKEYKWDESKNGWVEAK